MSEIDVISTQVLRRMHLAAIGDVAKELNQEIEFRPFLRSGIADEQVKSQHSLCRSLHNYRTALNAERPEVLDSPSLINFSAYIASTHFHLGGVPFAKLESVVNQMYQLEPDTMCFAWQQVADVDRDPKRRFDGFNKTANGLPLVGFPDLDAWNVDDWADALLKMPVADLDDKSMSGDSIANLFKRKRDLSIIQPREYGTVEFRGDPCLPTPEAILGVLAIRMGLVYYALQNSDGKQGAESFQNARMRWGNDYQKCELSSEIIRMARDGLEMNGNESEKYLTVFAL